MSLLNNETFEKKQTLEDFLKEYNENKDKIKDNFGQAVFYAPEISEEKLKKKQKKLEEYKKFLKENKTLSLKNKENKFENFDTYEMFLSDRKLWTMLMKFAKVCEEKGITVSLSQDGRSLVLNDKAMEVLANLNEIEKGLANGQEISEQSIDDAFARSDADEQLYDELSRGPGRIGGDGSLFEPGGAAYEAEKATKRDNEIFEKRMQQDPVFRQKMENERIKREKEEAEKEEEMLGRMRAPFAGGM